MFIFPGVLYDCVFILKPVKGQRREGERLVFQDKSQNEIEEGKTWGGGVIRQTEGLLASPQAEMLH